MKDNTFGIYHEFTIAAPIEQVFAAVSQPAELVNWWPLSCTGTPAVDESYNLHFGPEYDWYGEVSECESSQTFFIKMTQSDPDWNPTTFGFSLTEEKGKVRLSFSHVGWKEINQHFRISSFCWAILLNGLKNYVEKGVILPFEERS